ncbi:Oidioi.mRNA.OKI2018_I69.PAR.g9869.t1.cds [Oikopleura dioica]|uniref:Oidioi.mRNA.OKI2018_I69.PAR.g9869.t1.cds n=1 Tax=Oikopleura dioica TaxID=34765 RepID=A0ABN7RS20_OIKDI|nr:Oidioi.mRNA.OKI2018_I69.PAR.g9869.t1.cds [Oikopleura dioica]
MKILTYFGAISFACEDQECGKNAICSEYFQAKLRPLKACSCKSSENPGDLEFFSAKEITRPESNLNCSPVPFPAQGKTWLPTNVHERMTGQFIAHFVPNRFSNRARLTDLVSFKLAQGIKMALVKAAQDQKRMKGCLNDELEEDELLRVAQTCEEAMEIDAKGMVVHTEINQRGILIRSLGAKSWKTGVSVTTSCYSSTIKTLFKLDKPQCKRLSNQFWRSIKKLQRAMFALCSKDRCEN